MPRRKRSSPVATALKLGELSVAAPQVVAHRVARMALNGPFYSKRDQAEFVGMVLEKQLAFAQSGWAMFAEGVRVQQEFWRLWVAAFMRPPGLAWRAPQRGPVRQAATGLLRVADKGLSPIHAKAVSNARRLARTRLR